MSLDSVFNRPIDDFEKHLPEIEPMLQKASLSLSAFGTPVIQVPGYKGSYSVRKLENQVFEAANRAMRNQTVFSTISIESFKSRLAGHNISQNLYRLLNSPTDNLYTSSSTDRYVNPIPRLCDQKMAQIRSTFFGKLFSPICALWYRFWIGVSSMIEKKKYPHERESAAYGHWCSLDQRFRAFPPRSNADPQMLKLFKKVVMDAPDDPGYFFEPHQIEDAIKTLEKPGVATAETNPTVHQVESDFFKAITPQTIDEQLDVLTKTWCVNIKPNFLGIYKEHFTDKEGNPIYAAHFQCDDHTFTWHPLNVKNGKFSIDTGKDSYASFKNLDEFLRYLFKGEFYQGEAFRTDHFIMRTKDGSEIQYQNPFK